MMGFFIRRCYDSANQYWAFWYDMGGLMSNVNKEVSISKQAIIRDTDAGKRFSSSLNVPPHVLSSSVFILSDQTTLWLLNPIRPSHTYI